MAAALPVSELWLVDSLTITIRILLAVLLGGLIGLEREYTYHAAGLRTHILVCVGAAGIMLLSIYGFSDFVNETNVRVDPARLATAVISGIGFLGAGTIMQQGGSVTGLTTAASLWVVAAIGLAIGAGFYYSAFLSTGVVFLCLFALSKVEQRLIGGGRIKKLRITLSDRAGSVADVSAVLQAGQAEIIRMSIAESEADEEGRGVTMALSVRLRRAAELPVVLEQIRALPGVKQVQWDGEVVNHV